MNENQPEKKEKNEAEKPQEKETNNCAESAEKQKSYYYDDAHGYEIYDAANEEDD